MKGKFGCIICDPPFLSPDCQSKGIVAYRDDRLRRPLLMFQYSCTDGAVALKRFDASFRNVKYAYDTLHRGNNGKPRIQVVVSAPLYLFGSVFCSLTKSWFKYTD